MSERAREILVCFEKLTISGGLVQVVFILVGRHGDGGLRSHLRAVGRRVINCHEGLKLLGVQQQFEESCGFGVGVWVLA